MNAKLSNENNQFVIDVNIHIDTDIDIFCSATESGGNDRDQSDMLSKQHKVL